MNTLFDKIWDAHVVTSVAGGPDQLYIDRHYCHEVTSPQAFNELRERKLKVFRPQKTICSPYHNKPTLHQDQPIADPVSRNQVDTLARNAREFGLTYYGLGNEKNGIILEAELPETDLSRRRVAFYERYGFKICPKPYFQPPYHAGEAPLPLLLMYYGWDSLDGKFEEIRDTLHANVYGTVSK